LQLRAIHDSSLRGAISRRVFGKPWLVVVGGMRYTIYLIHGPIISTTLFVLLERPCMNPAWPSLLAAKARSVLRRRSSNSP